MDAASLDSAKIDAYLERLGVARPAAPDAAALEALTRAHLEAIPFENLDVVVRLPLSLELDALFDKLVTRKRGGFCFELNGLFAALLEGLGFSVRRHAARVTRPDGGLGIAFDHLCLAVTAEGQDHLVDVGFGDALVAPLALEDGAEQVDDDRRFTLERRPKAWALRRADGAADPVELYVFEDTVHPLAAFAPGLEFHQRSPESPFTGRRIVTRKLPGGRVTLSEGKRTLRDAGKVEVTDVDEAGRAAVLAADFGITLDAQAGVGVTARLGPGRPLPPPRRDVDLNDLDLHMFHDGTHRRLWEVLGAHRFEVDGEVGVRFAVWAPNAAEVSVVGPFNGWDLTAHPMARRDDAGVWVAFVPGVDEGAAYKYAIRSNQGDYEVQKADPMAFRSPPRPETASLVWDLDGYQWGDDAWVEGRAVRNALDAPMSIYEVHLGSWMRVPEEDDRWLTYRELAPKLAEYCKAMGFTHVELLPLHEHPFDGSWGYQVTGYYAATSRFGSPQDLMFLVDTLHQAGIGVILDWVPGHFPRDEHGLGFFDGTHLYEHADPRQGEHKQWGTFVFNYGRSEVQSFLISNALFWLEVFHIDGLRVDAVASMLYLDYNREPGEWVANEHGGRENLEAIDLLKKVNDAVASAHPHCRTIAEESTSWPMVSRPTYLGGLGFSLKWNMGWMHDTLEYVAEDPIHRSFHHHKLTFAMMYAFHENFVLPYSHDEVVHGKRSLLGRMPGDRWQQFANMRALFGWMWCHPGKKLLFMGGELGQWREWDHDGSVDWHLLEHEDHKGLQLLVGDLNRALRANPAMYQRDHHPDGFVWVDCNDSTHSVYSFLRWDQEHRRPVLCVFNFTPVVREKYRLGVPQGGRWDEFLNSDAPCYGGSGVGNSGSVEAQPVESHGYALSLELTLPPLGVLLLRPGQSKAVLPYI